MIIKKITIENFRCFQGKHEVLFSTDGKITLVYGLSGSGKTSFLHFLKWVLYNDRKFSDKGKDNYHLYNEKLDEKNIGEKFNVSGIIEFNNKNVDYQLIRTSTFKRVSSYSVEESNNLTLLFSEDGNWKTYTDKVEDKINEILPSALSKFFFFHGEKLDDVIGKDNGQLSMAINNLFGLTKYIKGINHLGDKTTRGTVICKYTEEQNKKLKTLSKTKPTDIYKDLTNKQYSRSVQEKQYDIYKASAQKYKVLYEQKIKEVGKIQNSKTFEDAIKSNENLIKEYEKNMKIELHNIGKLFYSCVPNLMLAPLTQTTVTKLSIIAHKEKNGDQVVFANTNKSLLKEIIDKKTCVCGRCITKEESAYIQTTIDSMPPNSYFHQLKVFAEKTKSNLEDSISEYEKYIDFVGKYNDYQDHIFVLNDKNRELKEELKKTNDTKKIYEEMQEYDTKRRNAETQASKLELVLKTYDKQIAELDKQYKEAVAAAAIKDEYTQKLDILYKTKDILSSWLSTHLTETKESLEKMIKEVYVQLSTRLEDNFDSIRFVNNDFSLRDEYHTGGQLAIDVYSYVLGMIKALHCSSEEEAKENEFPIVIEAPFSHTDAIQSTHVFETLPKIANQVIILTLELDKFKTSISDEIVGLKYIISNNKAQTISEINKCSSLTELFEVEAKDKEKSKKEVI